MLSLFSYISVPASTSNVKADVQSLLCLYSKTKRTFDHAKEVAEMNVKIAEQYNLDINVCELSGYLHDISAVIYPNDMLAYAKKNGWDIDEAEKKYPFLIHQRISRIIAQEDFNIKDERILSAIEHHSTLKSSPSVYDMALFIADKLAWDQEGEAPFYSVVNNALKESLEAASLAYMDYIVKSNMILYPHRWFIEGPRFLREKLDK